MTTELSLDKFEPTKAELTTLVTDAEKALIELNPEDKLSMDLFKSRKKELQQARLRITEVGKSMRSEALAFQKSVIEKEKELLSIITPTEDKMKDVLDEIKQAEIRKERLAEMPQRRAMLSEIGDQVTEPTDDELLDMDHDAFVSYMNQRKADQFERQQVIIRAEREAEKRAEELRLAEEAAARRAQEEAEQKAEEDRLRAQEEAQEKIDAARRAQEEAERKLRAQEEAAEAARLKEEAEKKKRAEDERYNKWLKDSYYTPTVDWHIVHDGKVARLYSLADTFIFE